MDAPAAPVLCGEVGGTNKDGRPCRRRSYAGGLCAQHAGAHPGGRPRFDFTDEQLKQLDKLASLLPMERIADFFDIHEETLRRRFHDDERVKLAISRGRAKVEATMVSSLITAGTNGDVNAIKFYLASQAPGWGEKKHVVSGPEGGAIPHALTVRFVRPGEESGGDG